MEAFKSEKVLPAILRRLLLQDVVRQYTQEEIKARNVTLYRNMTPATSFTLVLEGQVEVEVGREGMKFEAGPFHHFGVQALELADDGSGEYVPDFTVRPVSNCLLLVVSCKHYLDARKATVFQRTKDQESSTSPLNSSNYFSSPSSFKVEASVSPPGRLSSIGRPSKSVRSVTKRLCMGGGRLSDEEESHHLLQDPASEDEEESHDTATDTTLPHPPTAGRASSPVVLPAELEMQVVARENVDSSNHSPPPPTDPHNTVDSSKL